MEKENCEQILEIKDKTSVTIIKEFRPDCAKIQFNSVGEVRGKYTGSHTETVDILQKMDGTNEWESRAIDVTPNGEIIMVSGRGMGKMQTFQGEYTFMTNSQNLSWLNTTKTWVEGTVDPNSMGATIKVYAMKQMESMPTPM